MSATATDSADFVAIASTNETIHADGIPRIIPPALVDRAFIHAQHAYKNDGDRILVHRKTVDYNDNQYTVDYITTKIMDVWHQYTVIYLDKSPFPHTIDLRFETSQSLVEQPKIQCSSSNFRAAAYAFMKANPQF